MPEKKQKADEKPFSPDALDSTDPLDKVVFFGAKLKRDVREDLLTADLDMSTDLVSELTLEVADPDFKHLRKGLFEVGLPVLYEDMMMEVASVEVQPKSGNEVITVRCRPRSVRRLKKRRGVKVMRQASPTDFVKAECQAVNVNVVAQDSPKRKQVARDVKRRGHRTDQDGEAPSSWTTFRRLADELGYIMFEAAGTIYFGKPTWLLKRHEADAMEVNWKKDDEKTWTIQVPQCSRSADNEDIVSVAFQLPVERGQKLRPGQAIKLSGVPSFNDTYLVQSVTYSLLRADYVTVQAGTPEDPEKALKEGRAGAGAGGGGGTTYTRSLRDLLQKTGFSGDRLEVAIAVVMAESGGSATAQGDQHLADSKWGNSVGLFQIRSLRHPDRYSGTDRLRDAKKLLNPVFNAQAAYQISNEGTNWGPWSAYTSGAYRKFYKTGTNYQIKNWTPPRPDPAPDSGGGAAGGRGTGALMANIALSQAGDRYIYGAEASASDANPSAFDCSELVEWATRRAGGFIPDGSTNQINYCASKGTVISVERAIAVRGALLWKPGHIAISLGNGSTIEAVNSAYGVRVMSATNRSFRWSKGALVPGLRY